MIIFPRKTPFLFHLAIVAAAVLAGSTVPAAGQGLELHVSPGGNDGWSGRVPDPGVDDGPLATLEGARDAIRKLKSRGALPGGGVAVILHGGTYERTAAFELSAIDSGTEDSPIVYSACRGEEVRLTGGREVGNFEPLDDRSRSEILAADLGSLGITDLGEATGRGNRLELFFNDHPMELARWPNSGFVRIVDVVEKDGHKIHGIAGSKTGKFVYEGDRPRRWVGEKEVWLHGYWFWDWADAFQQAAAIDTENRTIAIRPPYHNYGYRKGQRYYALNLLSEIDVAGEWYCDREEKVLYFLPPAHQGETRACLSVLPTLIELEECSHVTFRGLILEMTRSTAVVIKGGRGNRIAGCVIRNTGSNAVTISGGSENGVIGCDIYGTGEGGIRLSGGDRRTLTPGGNYAENNHIFRFGRIYRTYRPAVAISGTGNRVAHNLIHNGPHNAIQLSGNDHLIEFNEIHDVCFETGDVGAFYMGRDWTMRGTVIRHNFFHHIKGPGLHGAMAVYLDDAASGIEISGNVFYKAGRAAFIGGGRDNRVANNIFVECSPSVHVDARGLGWMKYHIDGVMKERLLASPHDSPLWRKRYPQLEDLLDDDPGAPKGNVVERNISVRGKWLHIEKAAEALVRFEDNLVDRDPLFMNEAGMDFRLRDDSPAYRLGFEPIPIEKIGLHEDDLRRSLPIGR